jgi:hypothetical protein
MRQVEMVIEELKQLSQANVQQVAAFVHEVREPQLAVNRRVFADTAGCMSPDEADEFQRLIDERERELIMVQTDAELNHPG